MTFQFPVTFSLGIKIGSSLNMKGKGGKGVYRLSENIFCFVKDIEKTFKKHPRE